MAAGAAAGASIGGTVGVTALTVLTWTSAALVAWAAGIGIGCAASCSIDNCSY